MYYVQYDQMDLNGTFTIEWKIQNGCKRRALRFTEEEMTANMQCVQTYNSASNDMRWKY